MSFSFSTPKTASGFTLPTANAPTTTAATGLQVNAGAGDNKLFAPSKPLASVFATPTTSATAFSGFSNLPNPPTGSANLPLIVKTTKAAAPPFLIPAGVTATSSQFGVGTSVAATSLAAPSTTTFTPILGAATSTTGGTLTAAAASTAAASTAAPKLSFGLAPTSTVTSTALAPTSVTTTTSTIPTTGTLSFVQLEDSINKWTIDLEEQGKFFINQAKQLNAWDSLLISNGEKILNLNSSIERVKQQQTQLDQELDFVLAQQKELEELIMPLEKELVEIPVTDIDRNQMYQFSEIIDSQLKQMSEDLKEIIEHINENHKDEESNNPVTQISRILNAHMNSLQWIDRNTAQISSHLEQITKMQDTNRRNIPLNQSFNM